MPQPWYQRTKTAEMQPGARKMRDCWQPTKARKEAYSSFALDPLEEPALLRLQFQMSDLQPARGKTSLLSYPVCGHLSLQQDMPTFPYQKVLVESLSISLPWYGSIFDINSSRMLAMAGANLLILWSMLPSTYLLTICRVPTAYSQRRAAVDLIRPWLFCSVHLGSVHSEHRCLVGAK